MPTFEPVTLNEAKKQCEIALAIGAHDEHLTRLIQAAREVVEHDTGLAICTGAYTWKFTNWPCTDYFEIPGVRPVTAVSSIVYVDTSGTSTTWTASEYVLETSTVTPIVRLAYGESWPSLRGDLNGVTVTLTAGYATPLVVPQVVKQAVLLALHIAWLEHSEVDPSRQQEGYERVIARIMRSTYP